MPHTTRRGDHEVGPMCTANGVFRCFSPCIQRFMVTESCHWQRMCASRQLHAAIVQAVLHEKSRLVWLPCLVSLLYGVYTTVTKPSFLAAMFVLLPPKAPTSACSTASWGNVRFTSIDTIARNVSSLFSSEINRAVGSVPSSASVLPVQFLLRIRGQAHPNISAWSESLRWPRTGGPDNARFTALSNRLPHAHIRAPWGFASPAQADVLSMKHIQISCRRLGGSPRQHKAVTRADPHMDGHLGKISSCHVRLTSSIASSRAISAASSFAWARASAFCLPRTLRRSLVTISITLCSSSCQREIGSILAKTGSPLYIGSACIEILPLCCASSDFSFGGRLGERPTYIKFPEPIDCEGVDGHPDERIKNRCFPSRCLFPWENRFRKIEAILLTSTVTL